jgi:hypothetical protein
MVYGDEKAREMARSLLPSKNREPARKARAFIQRAERHRARMETARLARDPEESEDLASPTDESAAEMRQQVSRRRWGDKVAPFIRWACATTRALPQESRLSHVRARVPRGIIGDHALEHLKCRAEFEHPNEAAVERERRRVWERSRRQTWPLNRGEQAERLRAILQTPGGHRAFNRYLQCQHVARYRTEMRRRPCTCRPGCTFQETVRVAVSPIRARVLLGVHDVLPFLEALWGPPPKDPRWWSPQGPHAEQMDAVEQFLRAFKRHRGDMKATAQELRLDWLQSNQARWTQR